MTREDCIHRQALLNMYECLDEESRVYAGQVVRDVKALPSVTPTRTKGKWIIKDGKEQGYDIAGIKTWYIQIMCNKCGFIKTAIEGHTGQYNYCPNCGAEMKSEQLLNYADQDTMIPAT